jgi:hypothetical protein
MTNPKIITIGTAGKGCWWYAINDTEAFEDGFPTEQAAVAEAMAACGTPWELWYRCTGPDGRKLMVPGAKSADHPENQ